MRLAYVQNAHRMPIECLRMPWYGSYKMCRGVGECVSPDAQMEQEELPLVLYVPSAHAILVSERWRKMEEG